MPGSHGLQINLCKCLLPSSQGCLISISNLICPKLNSSPNRIFNSSSTAILAFQILRPKPLEPSCFYCPHPILQKTCHLHFQKSPFMTTSTTPFYPSPNQDHLPKLFPSPCFPASTLDLLKPILPTTSEPFKNPVHGTLICSPNGSVSQIT